MTRGNDYRSAYDTDDFETHSKTGCYASAGMDVASAQDAGMRAGCDDARLPVLLKQRITLPIHGKL